jgi:dTDP-glucose pyrophosphorylase
MITESFNKVLITTSGVGSRLGDLTTYTNKSLVKLGDKPAISWIIESYPESTSFVVTLGHYGEHVADYLTISYPNKDIVFVDIDNYDGPGSSLAFSMLQARRYLDEPFIFNASDTIVTNFRKPDISGNWVGGYKGKTSANYTTFNRNGRKISTYNPKGWPSFDLIHIGLVGIKDVDEFWKELQAVLENSNSDQLNDVSAIERMIKRGVSFSAVEFSEWLDIGNIDSLEKAREHQVPKHDVLEKPKESIFFVQGKVVKFFYDDTVCRQRIERTRVLQGLVPEIIDTKHNFFSYEYLNGDVLSKGLTTPIFEAFLEWCKSNLWKRDSILSDIHFREICFKFYYDKTKNRSAEFLERNNQKDKDSVINGVEIPPLNIMLDQAIDYIVKNSIQSRIHGDLVLDNVLLQDSKQKFFSFKLIDWRQDFSGSISVGDLYYDLAKLAHSFVINHKMIKNNQFMIDINLDRDEVFCDIHQLFSLNEANRVFHEFLNINGLDVNLVRVISAIIWINMAPLHHHPFDLFLYNLGKYSLYIHSKEVSGY